MSIGAIIFLIFLFAIGFVAVVVGVELLLVLTDKILDKILGETR